MGTQVETETDNPTSLYTNSTNESTDYFSVIFMNCLITSASVGLVANIIIVVVIITDHSLRSKPMNVLIWNQSLSDFIASLSVIVTYSARSAGVALTGYSFYLYCHIIDSEIFIWWAMFVSMINLVFISMERYLMVVHPVFYMKRCTVNILFMLVILTWIIGFVCSVPVSYLSTVIVNNECWAWSFVNDPTGKLIYGVFTVCYAYFAPTISFVVAYGMIFRELRRKKVAVHASQSNSSATVIKQEPDDLHKNRSQRSVLKTCITVMICFLVLWGPNQMYYLIFNLRTDIDLKNPVYYFTLIMLYVDISVEPFIYAAQHRDVRLKLKKILENLFRCIRGSWC